jgi:hypothetical protein
MYFNDGKYKYTGLVDSKDIEGKCVWAGCNSAGFAIMNSASYNLNMKDTTSKDDAEGILMKLALKTCATLNDFEKLVKSMPHPIGLQANFGVIDAKGGAAYYEIGNDKFAKFDANDSTIAPFGYIIRTNYSYIGVRDEDHGAIRYNTAESLINSAYYRNALSPKFFIKDVTRCLKHSLTNINLLDNIPAGDEEPDFVNYQDFIPNYYSAASVIIQGVKRNEPPSLTTMWTVLGFPLCSVSVPVWVEGGGYMPSVLLADSSGNAPLCTWASKLKERVFPLIKGFSYNYINLAALVNKQNTGIMQKLAPLENTIIKEAELKLRKWYKSGINDDEMHEFYNYVNEKIKSYYKENYEF